MTEEESWMYCKLRAKARTERRAEWKQKAEDGLMVAAGFLWFFGLLALAGILM